MALVLRLRDGLRRGALLLLGLLLPVLALASPLEGRWHLRATPSAALEAVQSLPLEGGRFEFIARVELAEGGRRVIDFNNSSVIGRFQHELRDERGLLVARLEGGLQSAAPNPYFLRHGRTLQLPAGRYQLHTVIDTPFLLGQPQVFIDDEAHYLAAIKPGNTLTLVCLGLFIGLGFFYGTLALFRRRWVEGCYALFILGNLLYNATALNVVADVLGVRAFYLISLPIVFSNMAYVAFVMRLLGITAQQAPRMHRLGQGLLVLMGLMAAAALMLPHWSLHFARAGVALFLGYGMAAGVVQAVAGQRLARVYLAANIGFFLTGILSISFPSFQGLDTLYVEHVGLLAVAIEVLLLAMVQAHQFGELQREREAALARAEQGLQLATTDALTGLPNRYAMEQALAALPITGCLTFVDLDGLKQINDRFGHAVGDQVLHSFAVNLRQSLGPQATAHRLGGDEFAVLSTSGDSRYVELKIQEAAATTRACCVEFSGASFGSACLRESGSLEQLKHLADTRMYQQKHQGRRVRTRVAYQTSEP
ncbi:diguanylate cyclase [Pelomonas sp. V22]|uniref:sensor domain-containing diguanylate cyclase n=1 Tax=Pelomonas sp. V22 TaxID=2822139 RepID=UPI0024A9E1A0|nr:diguanylate cyclase [Pelomonas sp. V22]MDI4635072.1 diguanylate cyclase [Pelomonas sp. V22]